MKLKYTLIAVSFFIAAINLQAQSKVGTVNINAILSKLPELSSVQEKVNTYNNKLNTDLVIVKLFTGLIQLQYKCPS